ncbi:MAG: phosphate signaling complex protein PhoU [Gemmatimonadetes bacterium]|nr:phosphate signaling complex protein PhoU [Gemmatimonadota bacterium]
MNAEQKTRRHFHDELETLQKRLVEMAGIVESLVERATKAVLTRNSASVADIIAEDSRVDELEVEVDERVVELLALFQPMASDLRQIITSNKVANDLERVGDHAVNIAKAARRLVETQPLPELRELAEMAEITREMLADALASYVTRNAGTARMVCITDDKVDNLRGSLFRILVTHMLEEPKRIGGALELLLVSQNLERVADLSTNIAEDVVFLVEGRTIKHGAEAHRGSDGAEDDEAG